MWSTRKFPPQRISPIILSAGRKRQRPFSHDRIQGENTASTTTIKSIKALVSKDLYKVWNDVQTGSISLSDRQLTSLVSTTSKKMSPRSTVKLFKKLLTESPTRVKPNTVTFNAALGAWKSLGVVPGALSCLETMSKSSSAKPDLITFYQVLGTCTAAATTTSARTAQKLLNEMEDLYSVVPDTKCYNLVLTLYTKRRQFKKALELYNEIPNADIVSHHIIMQVYKEIGKADEALNIFHDIDFSETESLHHVLEAYCHPRTRKPYDAYDFINQSSSSFKSSLIDLRCWNIVLQGFAADHNHDMVFAIWNERIATGTLKPDINTLSVVLGCYLKSGMYDEFNQIYNQGEDYDIRFYNKLLSVTCSTKKSCHIDASKFVWDLLMKKLDPDSNTMRLMLKACAQSAGNSDLAKEIWTFCTEKALLSKTTTTDTAYAVQSLVLSLALDGKWKQGLDIVADLITNHKLKPKVELFNAVLVGCQKSASADGSTVGLETVLERMSNFGLQPNDETICQMIYTFGMNSKDNASAESIDRLLFAVDKKEGGYTDAVSNALMWYYGKTQQRELLHQTWKAINGERRRLQPESYARAIVAFSQIQEFEFAIEIYKDFLALKVESDDSYVTNAALKAFSEYSSNSDFGVMQVYEMNKHLHKLDVVGYNTILKSLCYDGRATITEVQAVFDHMITSDVLLPTIETFTTMMQACAEKRDPALGISFFNQCDKRHLIDSHCYGVLFHLCKHPTLVSSIPQYLLQMDSIPPNNQIIENIMVACEKNERPDVALVALVHFASTEWYSVELCQRVLELSNNSNDAQVAMAVFERMIQDKPTLEPNMECYTSIVQVLDRTQQHVNAINVLTYLNSRLESSKVSHEALSREVSVGIMNTPIGRCFYDRVLVNRRKVQE